MANINVLLFIYRRPILTSIVGHRTERVGGRKGIETRFKLNQTAGLVCVRAMCKMTSPSES